MSDERTYPFFVYGAHRTGTTLLRLLIHEHPALRNPGEYDFLLRHLEFAPDGRLVYDLEGLESDFTFYMSGLDLPATEEGSPSFDAMLDALLPGTSLRDSITVHDNLERLLDVVPRPRVVHLVRDPRDVALSVMHMGWVGLPDFGAQKWIEVERTWDRVRPRLRDEDVLELRYEDLLAHPEQELGRLCAFCGVDFDPAMLRFHERTTYGPLNTSSIGRWRHRLDERTIARIEGQLGDLLERRGYAPAGAPAVNDGAATRLLLRTRNRLLRATRQARRIGYALWLRDALYRRFGPRRLQERTRRKIFAHNAQTVK